MTHPPRISVIIPALNAEAVVPAAIAAVREDDVEIVVVDGGSGDGTVTGARQAGAKVIASDKGRGQQLRRGGEEAVGDWLLFLHADTRLQAGWRKDAAAFAANPANETRAAVYTYALDDLSPQARRVERLVGWRTRVLGLPYGDQGLLISRGHYDRLGGFRAMQLMEDVDLVRRIGKPNLTVLGTRAVTSAARYRRGGWWARPLRNLFCLMLYYLRVPPRILMRIYR